MNDDIYAKAYTEVLEILKYFSEEERSKIPVEIINFFKKNMDINYFFKINPHIDLAKQYISEETNAIIITLFRDYFATEKQKVNLNEILKINDVKIEQEKRKKYNPNDLFKNNTQRNYKNNISKQTAIICYKEKNFIQKLLNKIKNLLRKN